MAPKLAAKASRNHAKSLRKSFQNAPLPATGFCKPFCTYLLTNFLVFSGCPTFDFIAIYSVFVRSGHFCINLSNVQIDTQKRYKKPSQTIQKPLKIQSPNEARKQHKKNAKIGPTWDLSGIPLGTPSLPLASLWGHLDHFLAHLGDPCGVPIFHPGDNWGPKSPHDPPGWTWTPTNLQI